MVNKHLLSDLTEMGLWSPNLKNRIIYESGSVQKISEIPNELWKAYFFALPCMVQGMGDWSGFMDKIHEVVPMDQQPELLQKLSEGNFTMRIMYEQFQNILKMGPIGQGLKTGMYYLGSRAAADAIEFTADTSAAEATFSNTIKKEATISSD